MQIGKKKLAKSQLGDLFVLTPNSSRRNLEQIVMGIDNSILGVKQLKIVFFYTTHDNVHNSGYWTDKVNLISELFC